MTSFSQNATTNDLVLVSELYVGSDGTTHIRSVFKLCTGLEAYANLIADAVRTLKGEIQLDTTIGIPYLDTIWDSPNRLEAWKWYVRKRVEEFTFVTSITEFTTELHALDHKLTYTLKVATDKGELSVGQTLEG